MRVYVHTRHSGWIWEKSISPTAVKDTLAERKQECLQICGSLNSKQVSVRHHHKHCVVKSWHFIKKLKLWLCKSHKRYTMWRPTLWHTFKLYCELWLIWVWKRAWFSLVLPEFNRIFKKNCLQILHTPYYILLPSH